MYLFNLIQRFLKIEIIPVAWEKLCKPKTTGGLNMTSMMKWNQTTMLKLLQNLQTNAGKLWIKQINAYYVKGRDIMRWQELKTCSWMIKKVLNCIELMSNSNYLEKTTQQNKYRTSSMYNELR